MQEITVFNTRMEIHGVDETIGGRDRLENLAGLESIVFQPPLPPESSKLASSYVVFALTAVASKALQDFFEGEQTGKPHKVFSVTKPVPLEAFQSAQEKMWLMLDGIQE